MAVVCYFDLFSIGVVVGLCFAVETEWFNS